MKRHHRGPYPVRWRLLMRADRIRRRLWPGLCLSVWLGCAHPQPRASASLVAPAGPHDEFRAVTVGDRQVLCAIRVGIDGASFLLWPPIDHPVRAACETAYRAWLGSRQ